MLTREIKRWTHRHNLRWIDRGLADVVVGFNVFYIHRVSNTVNLIQVAYIIGQIRVVLNALEIGFEVAVVHGVKTN